MLNCTSFHLPKPDKLIEIREVSPGNLDILLEANDPNSNGMLCIEMKEKEPEEWNNGQPDLEAMFEFDMFSPDMEKKGVTIETQTIDNHKAYVAYSLENLESLPLVKLTAIIDLDESYYLHFNYYGTHHGEEQITRFGYIKEILKTLQITGNFAETVQLIADNREKSLKDRILHHQKNYTTAEEQAKDPFHARRNPVIWPEF